MALAGWLKQSTAVVISFGPFVDKTDGVSLETGQVTAIDHATTGIFLSKNGGTLTIRHQAVTASTYDAYGNYKVTLDTTDTNTLGLLAVQMAEAATHLPVRMDYLVLPANIYDSLISGSDLVDISVVQIAGSAVSTSTAQLGVNVVQAGATAWASGAITAASIASDAITAAKIADGAIDAATFAANAITAAKLDPDVATELNAAVIALLPTALVSGRIDASVGAIAAGAVTAAAVATGAIDADALAADAATEIADAVLSRNVSNVEVAMVATSLGGLVLKGVSRIVFSDAGDTLTVYRTDGTTAKFTQATTQTAMTPISALGVAT